MNPASPQFWPEIFNGSGGAHLYRKFFVDVADLVKETEKKYGKVSTIGKQLGYNLSLIHI